MAISSVLKDVLSIPTAPFHEREVMAYIGKFCGKHKIKISSDGVGNLIASYKRGHAPQPVIFAAHMDHPGFEVLEADGRDLQVGLMGGFNLKHFEKANVVVRSVFGLVRGKVTGVVGKKMWHGKPVYKVRLATVADVLPGDFGYYDVTPVKVKGDTLYTKAADNLASCGILLDLLKKLKKEKAEADVRVVFSRAEEVGFIGCIQLIEKKRLPKNVPIIVMECSSAKGGKVDIGGGPVVRVGDKQSGFVPAVDAWLSSVAEGLLKKDKKFKYQRALLAGGRCEASAYMLTDHVVGGLAFPLGNYHNMGDKGAAPEFISVSDVDNMFKLITALVKADRYKKALPSKKAELWKNFKTWRYKL